MMPPVRVDVERFPEERSAQSVPTLRRPELIRLLVVARWLPQWPRGQTRRR
jgi:hypothetical protein